jgi:hypothetical protein
MAARQTWQQSYCAYQVAGEGMSRLIAVWLLTVTLVLASCSSSQSSGGQSATAWLQAHGYLFSAQASETHGPTVSTSRTTKSLDFASFMNDVDAASFASAQTPVGSNGPGGDDPGKFENDGLTSACEFVWGNPSQVEKVLHAGLDGVLQPGLIATQDSSKAILSCDYELAPPAAGHLRTAVRFEVWTDANNSQAAASADVVTTAPNDDQIHVLLSADKHKSGFADARAVRRFVVKHASVLSGGTGLHSSS